MPEEIEGWGSIESLGMLHAVLRAAIGQLLLRFAPLVAGVVSTGPPEHVPIGPSLPPENLSAHVLREAPVFADPIKERRALRARYSRTHR
jgi:hypothetical protein